LLEDFLMKKRTYQMWTALTLATVLAFFALCGAILFGALAVKGAETYNPKGLRKAAPLTAIVGAPSLNTEISTTAQFSIKLTRISPQSTPKRNLARRALISNATKARRATPSPIPC